MKQAAIPPQIIEEIKKAQRNEITEHHIYLRLASVIKDRKNSEVLSKIGNDELRHYELWKKFTGVDVKPSKWKIFKFFWIARIFGLTFGIKLMENGEQEAQINYAAIADYIKDAKQIAKDEDEHEKQLIALIEEERLDYVGSIVLGLNDALVELTGALAGLTFALQNTRLIALAGLITGIAASFSMAASEYLSQKAEESENALKSSVYTGIAYITTVILLIMPYLLISHFMLCLAATLSIALMIIFFFNYYISVAKDLNFKERFFEMAFISLGVSAITFLIGVVIRQFLGIEV
ncbi:MAG TPA: VIT1/CCC1 transporter family protein, partial [Spirochaetota bacterium]|nr:VIT1/CCC1 transporter family protein [Spirochaetota bacterium]HPJ44429.1 VIT1/CCC1 transporter family protein [Spirochaetota bacterium]